MQVWFGGLEEMAAELGAGLCVNWILWCFPLQDTFDIRILMAKSVKYTVNFLEAKEEDLYRSVNVLKLQPSKMLTIREFVFRAAYGIWFKAFWNIVLLWLTEIFGYYLLLFIMWYVFTFFISQDDGKTHNFDSLCVWSIW